MDPNRVADFVNRRGDGDDVEVGLLELVWTSDEVDVTFIKSFRRNFLRGIFSALHHVNAPLMDVKADHA